MGCLETKTISVCIFDINQYLIQGFELKVKQNASSAEIGKLLYNKLTQYSSQFDMSLSFDVMGRSINNFSFLDKTRKIIVQLSMKQQQQPFTLVISDQLTIN